MKKRLLICVGILLIAATTVACSGIDLEKFGIDNKQAETLAEEVSTEDAGEAISEEAEEAEGESSDDSEFYFSKLKNNEELRIDLGSDGQMDTIFFKHPDGSGNDNSCSIKVNDQTVDIELVVENGFLYGEADAFFVHRSDGDYVLINEQGADGYGPITAYMWDKDSLKEVGKYDEPVIVDSSIDEKTNSEKYEIYPDKIVIGYLVDIYDCNWIATADLQYGPDGVEQKLEKEHKIHPMVEGLSKGLILKKDVEFDDESGNDPKVGKAGQTIIPYGMQGSSMSFTSEDGEYLGYIIYDGDSNELFENLGDFQVG